MDNPLKDYSFKVTPGHCWICEAKIESGIYCASCQQSLNPPSAESIIIPVNITHLHHYSTVAELRNGFSGFIKPTSVFYYYSCYWVFNNAVVSIEPGTDFEVKIRRSLTGTLFVVAETLNIEKMASMNSRNPAFITRVELDESEHSTPPQSLAMTTRNLRVSGMVDGDEGYTEPYAVFEMNGQLFIISTAGVLPKDNDLYKTMHIRKRNGFIEIDAKTINTDEIVAGYLGIEDEMDFEKAKLVPHF